MDFFRRHRVLSFLLFLVLFGVLAVRIIAPQFLVAQTTTPAAQAAQPATAGSSDVCKKVGNNAAIQFGNSEVSYDEAAYTLALFTGNSGEEQAIISAINNSPGTVIVRLGAGTAAKGPPAPEYISALKRISSAVNGKSFIATVGHNEANCAEKEDAVTEGNFMSAVINGAKGTPGLKLISGQIDYYCGTGNPKDYVKYLPLSQLDGIALPFYTGVAGGADATVAKLKEFMNVVGGKDIYITESGPYKGEFSDFANAIKTISTEPRVKAILLFNAFGANPDPSFEYTKPFWNPDCREALRTVCQDPQAVVEACSAPPSNYFEYNIQRKSVKTLLNNFAQDYSVACMPKESFKLVAKNRQNCGTAGIGCGNWNASGELSLSAQGKLFGLFRNEKQVNTRIASNKNASKRTESLETYLGVPSSTEPRATTTPITSGTVKAAQLNKNQGPVYNLTTLEEQCQLVQDKLDAVNNLCTTNRIEGDKSKCGLNTRIAGTDVTHLTLRSKIHDKSCADLMNPDPSNLEAVKLRDSILATPLAMETAYRPAFIVAVTKFDKPSDNLSVKAGGVPTAPGEEFYTLDYLEVKVPAFGSDFLPSSKTDEPSGKNIKYRDPLQVTSDLLTTTQQQDDFNREVQKSRDALRGAITNLPVKGGLVGNNGNTNVYCFIDGSWKPCQETASPPTTENEPGPDKLPIALSSFLNAYNNAGMFKDSLPCGAEEEAFYSKDNAKKIAGTVTAIGSDLGTKKTVGVFTKKQDIKLSYNVDIKSIADNEPLNFNTTTQLYFVSPHNSNLTFAQQSFYNFLTLDEQEKLKSLGLLSDDGVLNPEKFSPLLKTEIDDKFTDTTGGGGTRSNLQLNPPVTVSVGLEANLDKEDKPQKHPIFWQVGGQVASLPTRLMTLITTRADEFINQYTVSCTDTDDKEQLSHATENWLSGKCQAKPSATAPKVCAADPKKVTSASFSGLTTQISDGVIATALEVSKYTCVPAEVLVGVMAKESRGLTNINGNDVPASGDPNQIITRQAYCNNLDPSDQNSTEYFQACGAYQYAQSNIRDQIARYGVAVTSCLSKIAPGDTDTRKLGVSMCVAAANIWRSTYCSKNSCKASDVGSMYGCTPGKSLSLADYETQGYGKTNFLAGIAAFHGNHEADANYWAFVEQYTAAVNAVRAQCK